jgi:hypothetical protein
VRRELGADRQRQPEHAELARHVPGNAGRRVVAEAARDVHDLSALLRDHLRREEVAAVHDAAQVDAEHPVPIVERRVEDAARQPDARVVDDDVGGRRERVHVVGERLHLRAIGHVDATHERGARAELARERVEAGLIDVADRDASAVGGEAQRGHAPDAAGGAGDDDERIGPARARRRSIGDTGHAATVLAAAKCARARW